LPAQIASPILEQKLMLIVSLLAAHVRGAAIAVAADGAAEGVSFFCSTRYPFDLQGGFECAAAGDHVLTEDIESHVVAVDQSADCQPYPASLIAHNAIVLVERGRCGFVDKAKHAQAAGARGLAVYNNVGGDVDFFFQAPGVGIPVTVIPQSIGVQMAEQLQGKQAVVMAFTAKPVSAVASSKVAESNAGSSAPALNFDTVARARNSSVRAFHSVGDMLSYFKPGREEELLSLMLRTQSPPNCSTARYLIIDDLSNTSGVGMSFAALGHYAINAIAEGRVLVEAAHVSDKWHWHWCDHPPYSWKCFFQLWSPCESMYASGMDIDVKNASATAPFGMEKRIEWKGQSTMDDRVVWGMNRRSGRHDLGNMKRDIQHGERKNLWAAWKKVDWEMSVAGKFWWFGQVQQYLLQPQPWLEFEADAFTRATGLDEGPFLVAHVRHGNKGVEQKLIPTAAFFPKLKDLGARLGTRKVLLMTEDPAAVEEMVEWGEAEGFVVAYTNNSRTDGDVWNPDLRAEFGLDAPDMSEQVSKGSVEDLRVVLWIQRKRAGEMGERGWSERMSLACTYAIDCSFQFISDSTLLRRLLHRVLHIASTTSPQSQGPYSRAQLPNWSARFCHCGDVGFELDASYGERHVLAPREGRAYNFAFRWFRK
jgi:hypothetical protein